MIMYLDLSAKDRCADKWKLFWELHHQYSLKM